MPDFKDTERKIRRARSALLRGKPLGRGAFFGQLAMRLDLEADPKMQVPMATNGRVLRYHPQAIEQMNADHLVALVAHEVVHCVSNHHVRRGRRDPELWNRACDEAIAPELIDAGFSVPDEGQPDPRFKGMAAERIYTLLEQEIPPQGGEGEGEGGGRGQKGQPQKGKGKGEPQWGGDVTDMPGDEPSDGEGEGDGDGDPQEGRGPTSEEREREAREWQMAAAQAAAAAKQHGDLPGFAERFIAGLHRPKINPWERLREFVKERLNSDFRWCPPSRRFVSQGLYLPSIYSEDQLGEIVIAIDTSGSIDDKTLQTFGRHCRAIKEDFRPKRLRIIWCDAQVHRVDTFEQDDELVLKPCGGGGTDFRPIFRWVDKHMEAEPPICCIVLTDLYGPSPTHAPEYPVLWACISDQKAPWGETLPITVEDV